MLDLLIKDEIFLHYDLFAPKSKIKIRHCAEFWARGFGTESQPGKYDIIAMVYTQPGWQHFCYGSLLFRGRPASRGMHSGLLCSEQEKKDFSSGEGRRRNDIFVASGIQERMRRM
jgi:hypothetical protein